MILNKHNTTKHTKPVRHTQDCSLVHESCGMIRVVQSNLSKNALRMPCTLRARGAMLSHCGVAVLGTIAFDFIV